MLLHTVSLTQFLAQGFLLWPPAFVQQLAVLCAGFDPGRARKIGPTSFRHLMSFQNFRFVKIF